MHSENKRSRKLTFQIQAIYPGRQVLKFLQRNSQALLHQDKHRFTIRKEELKLSGERSESQKPLGLHRGPALWKVRAPAPTV